MVRKIMWYVKLVREYWYMILVKILIRDAG